MSGVRKGAEKSDGVVGEELDKGTAIEDSVAGSVSKGFKRGGEAAPPVDVKGRITKWTDKNGTTSYSDAPPVGVEGELLDIKTKDGKPVVA
ncbi:MAG: DUF4124 domain-containing protein, partial [bacterium]